MGATKISGKRKKAEMPVMLHSNVDSLGLLLPGTEVEKK
jgi:hypothetical protein